MIVPLWNTEVLAMYFLLRWYLKRIIRRGDLEVTAANGVAEKFGDGTGNRVSVRLAKRSLYWKLAFYPDSDMPSLVTMGSKQPIDISKIYQYERPL